LIAGEQKSKTNLGDAEIGEQEASSTRRSPNEEYLDLEASRVGPLVDQVGGCITDTKVPQPVGGNGEGHGLGTNVEREDLASNDPGDRTPGGGEKCNVDANESDQNLLSGRVRSRDRDANDGDQELANAHPGGTDQEQPPPTEPLDTPHTRKCHKHVDDVGGDGD